VHDEWGDVAPAVSIPALQSDRGETLPCCRAVAPRGAAPADACPSGAERRPATSSDAPRLV